MSSNGFLLEIACFTLESCLIAEEHGADRIEFCANPEEGGTTPSYGLLKTVKEIVSIPVFPIIRPRGGDFCFSESEFASMQYEVELCKQLGFEGVVIGMLHADGNVHAEWTKLLVDLAYPMDVTFHRAFDRCADPFIALETIIACGCQRILTSGQVPAAPDGAALIKELITQADDRICIMPGSGVKSKNVADLAQATGATEFHTAARTVLNQKDVFNKPSMNESIAFTQVDGREVKQLRHELDMAFNQWQNPSA